MSQIPGPIQKRDILFGVKKASPSQLSEIASELETLGWISDAADFYKRAESTEALEKLKQAAILEGNTFLLTKICRFLGSTDSMQGFLRECARNAEGQQKFRYALKAYELLEDVDNSERIRALISTDADIVAEAQTSVFIPQSEDAIEDADSE